MPNSHRVLQINKSGDQAELQLVEQALSDPGEKEVRVKLQAVGLNRADLLFQQDLYFQKPSPYSRIGIEGAGVVEACGPGSAFKEGDRIAILPMSIDIAQQGTLADYGIYRDEQLIPVDNQLSIEQASSMWIAGMSAWGGLIHAGQLKGNQYVLINAASSAVGIAAIQVSKSLGANVIACTRGEQKHAAIMATGADICILQPSGSSDYARYESELIEATQGQGIDLSFDAVAGPASRCLIRAARLNSTIVVHGRLDRRPMDIHAGALMKRQLTIKGYRVEETLNNSIQCKKAIEWLRAASCSGSFKIPIAKSFALTDYASAFRYLSENSHFGKVLVNID